MRLRSFQVMIVRLAYGAGLEADCPSHGFLGTSWQFVFSTPSLLSNTYHNHTCTNIRLLLLFCREIYNPAKYWLGTDPKPYRVAMYRSNPISKAAILKNSSENILVCGRNILSMWLDTSSMYGMVKLCFFPSVTFEDSSKKIIFDFATAMKSSDRSPFSTDVLIFS